MSQEKVNTLIIGAGPAGYTAAIYAARAGLNPLLYQGPQPGGQLTITTDVENYPGYPKGILGPKMMENFKEQAIRFGTQVRVGSVTSVDFSNHQELKVTIDQNHTITAATIIIATGASAKWLGLPSEKRLNGKGVSACAICDGFFFKGQDVAIVGGGDSAAEEALYLANICKKIYLLVRRDKLRASSIMQKRLMHTTNIKILWNTQTKEILGNQAVEGVQIINNKTGIQKTLKIQGFFVAIGHTPNTKIFTPYIETTPLGYIKTTPGATQTNIPGIFAAGDVQDAIYRQAVTAAGTGCMAALDAEKFLASQKQ